MTYQELANMVKDIADSAGCKFTYYQWPEGSAPNPPYVVFYLPGSDNFGADGKVYQKITELNIEFYTDEKDFEKESVIEQKLADYGIFYEKNESYIDSEKLYEVLYQMEVLING